MFKITSELFYNGGMAFRCFGLQSEKYSLYVHAFTTNRIEAERACCLLSSADTNRENLKYIIEDLVTERSLGAKI